MALVGAGEYEVGHEHRGTALEFRGVEVVIGVGAADGVEAVVVAVGEGGEGEAGDGGCVGHAAVHVESDGNSDTCTHGSESLRKLKSGVYLALSGVNYEEEAVVEHGGAGTGFSRLFCCEFALRQNLFFFIHIEAD